MQASCASRGENHYVQVQWVNQNGFEFYVTMPISRFFRGSWSSICVASLDWKTGWFNRKNCKKDPIFTILQREITITRSVNLTERTKKISPSLRRNLQTCYAAGAGVRTSPCPVGVNTRFVCCYYNAALYSMPFSWCCRRHAWNYGFLSQITIFEHSDYWFSFQRLAALQ